MEDIMEFSCALEGKKLRKNYKKFVLDIPELRVPKGYATALVAKTGQERQPYWTSWSDCS